MLVVTIALLSATRLGWAQNPKNDSVVFLHGLLSDSMSWKKTGDSLALYYRLDRFRPSIPWLPAETTQVAALNSYMSALSSNIGMFAKSNGAMVARGYIQRHAKVNRLATVVGPNSGAPLADHVWSEQALWFPILVQEDLADCFLFYGTEETRSVFGLFDLFDFMGDAFYFLGDTQAILAQFGFVRAGLATLAPVAQDLQTTSPWVVTLNSSSQLQAEAATANGARVAITGVMGSARDIMFYGLVPNQARELSTVRWWIAATSLLFYHYYSYDMDPSVPNYAQLQAGSYRWLNVFRDMVDIDPYWLWAIGAAPVFGSGGVAYTPNDGIIPLPFQQWPGATFAEPAVFPTSHMTINDDASARAVYQDVISTRFHIPARSTPVNSVVVSPGTASLVTGQAIQLTATPIDALGRSVIGRTVTWSGSSAVASVSSLGKVTALATGSSTIIATVDGYVGQASITVGSVLPLSESIQGQTTVRSGSTCSWTAVASGGVPPYTYTWTVTGAAGSPAGDQISVTAGSNSFTLKAVARDANGSTFSGTRSVSVSTTASLCQQ